MQRVQGEPNFIKKRNFHFYLPPSFGETTYKRVRRKGGCRGIHRGWDRDGSWGL